MEVVSLIPIQVLETEEGSREQEEQEDRPCGRSAQARVSGRGGGLEIKR